MKGKVLVGVGMVLVLVIAIALLSGGGGNDETEVDNEVAVLETDEDADVGDFEGDESLETAQQEEPVADEGEFHSVVDYSMFDVGANQVNKEVNKKLDRDVVDGEVKAFLISKTGDIATLKVAESRFRGINAGDTIQVNYGEVKFGAFSMTFFTPAGNENGVWQRQLAQ